MKKSLTSVLDHLPKALFTVPSILYLSIFQGLRFRGFGDIYALSINNGKLTPTIYSKGPSTIGKRVLIRARLELEEGVFIGDGCKITIGPVRIGRGTRLMQGVEVVSDVSIGKYCAIARNSVLQGENHMIKRPALQMGLYSGILGDRLPFMEKQGIEIGNDVWIGTRAIILPGVHIGDGAIIGAGSVVTKDVPPYSITAGAPAVHRKFRFSQEIIDFLEEVRWWDWPVERIRRNKRFFLTDLTEAKDLESLIVE